MSPFGFVTRSLSSAQTQKSVFTVCRQTQLDSVNTQCLRPLGKHPVFASPANADSVRGIRNRASGKHPVLAGPQTQTQANTQCLPANTNAQTRKRSVFADLRSARIARLRLRPGPGPALVGHWPSLPPGGELLAEVAAGGRRRRVGRGTAKRGVWAARAPQVAGK